MNKGLPVVRLKPEGVTRSTHSRMPFDETFLQLLIPEFCDRFVLEMRSLQVEIARPMRFDPAFGKRRTRANSCFVAYAIGHHPDAQLAAIRPGSEEREDKIDQV